MNDIFNIFNGTCNILKDNFKDIKKINKIYESKAHESSFFYLQLIDSSLKRELNNSSNKNVKLQILYYSNKDEPNLDYSIMADKLYDLFDYVTYDKFRYKVSEKSLQVSQDGLGFVLEFKNVSSRKKTEDPYMKNLKEGVMVKDDRK